MAKHEIETQWMGKMQFNALVNGHSVIMDAPERAGGEDNGPIPKPLILAALSGCTGMDIVALLRKSNEVINDFDIKVTGELSKQAPIQYVSIHLQYLFKADDNARQPVLQAVTDSQEKYCGVSSIIKKVIPVTWEIIFNDKIIFTNLVVEEVLIN